MNRNYYKLVTVKLRHNATDIAVFNRNNGVSKASVAHDAKSVDPRLTSHEQADIRLHDINDYLEKKACMDMSGVDAVIAYSDRLDHDDVCVHVGSGLREKFGGRLLMTNTVYTVEHSETSGETICGYDSCVSDMKFVNLFSIVKDYCTIHGQDPLQASLISLHIDKAVTAAVYDHGRITDILTDNKCKSDTVINMLNMAMGRIRITPDCILLTGRGSVFEHIKDDILNDIRSKRVPDSVCIIEEETHFERMADEAVMFFAADKESRAC